MTDFTPNTKKPTDLRQFESEDGIKFALDKSGEFFYLGWDALAQVCSIGLEEPIFAAQVKRTIEFYLSTKDTTVETPFEADVETPSGLQNTTLISLKLGTQAIKQHNPINSIIQVCIKRWRTPDTLPILISYLVGVILRKA